MIYNGIDIHEIARIRRLLDSKPDLLKKMFTSYEWEYASKRNAAQTLTGIWCAKESVVKAFSPMVQLDIRDIKIRHNPNGAPYLSEINNYELLPHYQIVLSISHTKNCAVANCIIFSVN